jgi:GNAT superfamily N-acetyltransferase
MRIAELDTSDATQTEELFALHQAIHAADTPDEPAPLREDFVASIRHPQPEARFERWLAWRDGRLIGWALLTLPEVDHRHLALAEVQVRPSHRRQGVGRALLDRVRVRAQVQRRRTLIVEAAGPVPGGPARGDAGGRFLTAMGFSPALEGVGRRIDLTAIDETAEQRLLDRCLPHATDYKCLGWTGFTPGELANGVAYLLNRMNVDAPTGDLDIGQSTLDTDRLREHERNALDRRSHLVGVAAQHRDTGQVGAVTMLSIRSAGDHGSVVFTIAAPKHRGHRLGTIVKVEIHRLARREFPGLRYIQTGNATANAHMVAINEHLGFVAYETNTHYQLAL